MKKSILLAVIAFCVGATPIVALAGPDDIYNCNTSGQATTGAGSTRPLGGPYVPVADYAVELNTGLLVYKECVLREIVTAKRKAALAALDTEVLKQFNSYPSREMGKEDVFLNDRTVNRYLRNDSLSNFNDTIEGKVKNWIGQAYNYARDPRLGFECKYTGDLNQVYSGTPSGNYWDAFDAVTDNPACSVFSASVLAYNAIEQQSAYELYKQHERLNWGQGITDVFHYDEDGFHVTDTPGAIVLANGIQSVQSGYVQAREADDIGEMTEGLYAGISNQVLTGGTLGSGSGGTAGSTGGLSAITQAISGALSYMEQVKQSAGGSLVTQTGNFTLDLLRNAIAQETAYKKVITDTIALFTVNSTALRTQEAQCYTDIANAVCQAGTINDTSCTATAGGTLTFIKETKFSQKVIEDNFRASALATTQKLGPADTNITAITLIRDALIANPTAAQQTIAQAALNAITLHNASNESTTYESFRQMLPRIVENAVKKWKEDPDPVKGWCNLSETAAPAVKEEWTACWSGAACPQAL
jgi:hypothetical protein